MNYIFYIPGLGDHYDNLRRAALRRWRADDVRAELIGMRWYDSDESYDTKYQRAHTMIQAALDRGDTVSLVGESAGASMAVSLFLQLPQIHRLVTIAGVNNARVSVAPAVLRRAPAFGVAMQAANAQLAISSVNRRSFIHTVNGLYDRIVGMASSAVAGAHSHRSLTVGHLMTIAVCLTLQKRRIIRYATSRG